MRILGRLVLPPCILILGLISRLTNRLSNQPPVPVRRIGVRSVLSFFDPLLLRTLWLTTSSACSPFCFPRHLEPYSPSAAPLSSPSRDRNLTLHLCVHPLCCSFRVNCALSFQIPASYRYSSDLALSDPLILARIVTPAHRLFLRLIPAFDGVCHFTGFYLAGLHHVISRFPFFLVDRRDYRRLTPRVDSEESKLFSWWKKLGFYPGLAATNLLAGKDRTCASTDFYFVDQGVRKGLFVR